MHNKRTESAKITCWLNIFAEFDFEIVCILDPKNRADGLSSIPENASPELGQVRILHEDAATVTLATVFPEFVKLVEDGYKTDSELYEIYKILKNRFCGTT